MKTIDSRIDVQKLVATFYAKVKKDELIGPVFLGQIPEEKWPAHLEKLTNFWETNLFGIRSYKGDPAQAHRDVDRNNNYELSQKHFGRWLEHWFTTVDALFEGEKAEKAKHSARMMATGQFLYIWKNRPTVQA